MKKKLYYTGIGSRNTPSQICSMFMNMAKELVSLGYVLRSGGADGADKAFEIGCDKEFGEKEIYLPWKNFNNHQSSLFVPSLIATKIAEQYHPNWPHCSNGARLLHGRNTHQVLGRDCNTPSQFVLCWTHPKKGGTTQAIRVAMRYDIPVANLYVMKNFVLDRWLEQFNI